MANDQGADSTHSQESVEKKPAGDSEKSARAIKRGGRTSGTRSRGNGAGWGGPAKGAGSSAGSFKPGKEGGPGRGHYSKDGEARLERQARHSEEMREILYDVAHNGEAEATRVAAAEKLLNRLEGLPVQRVLSAESDPISIMSDVALAEAIERQRRLVAAYQSTKSLPAARETIDAEPVPAD